MYNLDYLYLADLDIDTSRSARDITASALFVAINDNDYTTPMSAVVNRFVDWFFKATNPNIPKLNITLKHAYLSGDALISSNWGPSSLVPYSALTAKIASTLDSIMTMMSTKLGATASALTLDNMLPAGTVIVNKTDPSAFGTWSEPITGRCIKETVENIGLIPTDPSAAITALNVTSTNIMPYHKHEVTLEPISKSKTAKFEALASGTVGAFDAKAGEVWTTINPGSWDNGFIQTIVYCGDGYDGAHAAKTVSDKTKSIAEQYKTMFDVGSVGGVNETLTIDVSPPITQLTAAKIYVKE